MLSAYEVFVIGIIFAHSKAGLCSNLCIFMQKRENRIFYLRGSTVSPKEFFFALYWAMATAIFHQFGEPIRSLVVPGTIGGPENPVSTPECVFWT